jgi:hypothetical protein
MLYELYQLQNAGVSDYFGSTANMFDVAAIVGYLLSAAVLRDPNAIEHSWVVNVYCISLFLGFAKVYNNLAVIDVFRNLSNSIFLIMDDMKGYLMVF